MDLRMVTAVVTVAALGAATQVHAQTATQVIRFQVNAINQIAVSGSPTLIINTATPGNAPTSVTANGSSYTITTNELNQKITAMQHAMDNIANGVSPIGM